MRSTRLLSITFSGPGSIRLAEGARGDAREDWEGRFEALYHELEKPLFNTVYRWLWDDQEAMDLVQEAFTRLWATRTRIDPIRAPAWLFRTAVNLAANRRRGRKLWSWIGLETVISQLRTSAAPAESRLLQNERERNLRRAVDALPERHRTVLVLARFSGMSYGAIALMLAIPEGTVASRLNQALHLLEQRLGKQENWSKA